MKIKVTVLETVTVQRKTEYTVNAENEAEVLAVKGKSNDYFDIVDTEILTESEVSSPMIIDIIKAKVLTELKEA